MKSMVIVTILFLLPLSVWAGTFWKPLMAKSWRDGSKFGWIRAPLSGRLLMMNCTQKVGEAYIHLLTTGDSTWKDYTMELDVKPLKKHGIGGITIAVRG